MTSSQDYKILSSSPAGTMTNRTHILWGDCSDSDNDSDSAENDSAGSHSTGSYSSGSDSDTGHWDRRLNKRSQERAALSRSMGFEPTATQKDVPRGRPTTLAERSAPKTRSASAETGFVHRRRKPQWRDWNEHASSTTEGVDARSAALASDLLARLSPSSPKDDPDGRTLLRRVRRRYDPSLSEPPPVEPYLMCTLAEFASRDESSPYPAISVFECPYAEADPRRRTLCPRLAVARFRRAAAGTDPSELYYGGRSERGLEATADHLLRTVFVRRSEHLAQLEDAAAFVVDRLRAVHAERIARRIRPENAERARVVAFHILCGYVLRHCREEEGGRNRIATKTSDAGGGWTHTFNEAACAAALNAVRQGGVDDEDVWDECASYVVLRSATAAAEGERGQGVEATAGSWICGRGTTSSRRRMPRMRWAISWIAAVERGEAITVLRMLRDGPKSLPNSTSREMEKRERWMVLCRCCVASMLKPIRLAALKQYNTAWTKGEKVKDQDLADILCLVSPQSAVSLCRQIGRKVEPRKSPSSPVSASGFTSRPSPQTSRRMEYDCVFKVPPALLVDADDAAERREDDHFVLFGLDQTCQDLEGRQQGTMVAPPRWFLNFMMA
mmetsp:Transcript_26001/g.59816  ORF Transcript_26001/g.59816 Transcript_26001/m.59816 type:complete len:615 (-) Transcript_26001:204-2048(-)